MKQQKCCRNLKFRHLYFSNLTRSDDRQEPVFLFRQWISVTFTLYKYFSLHVNTYGPILMVQLKFKNFNFWKHFEIFRIPLGDRPHINSSTRTAVRKALWKKLYSSPRYKNKLWTSFLLYEMHKFKCILIYEKYYLTQARCARKPIVVLIYSF